MTDRDPPPAPHGVARSTLADGDITTRPVGRRRVLNLGIAGAVAIAAGVAMAVGTPAHAGGMSGGVLGDRSPP
jgi:hypothetical protein